VKGKKKSLNELVFIISIFLIMIWVMAIGDKPNMTSASCWSG